MPASKAHIKATAKFEAKAYDKILLRVRKDSPLNKQAIQDAAGSKSLNSFILEAVQEKIEKTK